MPHVDHRPASVSFPRPRALVATTGAAALALALALGGCGKGGGGEVGAAQAAAPPKVKAELVPVQQAPMPQFLTLSGTLAANEESDVAAGASGKVLATFVERGSFVKKGAILARLDVRMAAAAAREATAQVATLRAQRELAKADCERSQQLFAKGAMTKVDFDRAQTACRTADSSAAAAEARQVAAATTLADATIRAPFSGLVAERAVSAGEFVRPESKIATIVQVDPLRLELTIPEAYVPRVGKDMQVEFRTAAESDAAPLQAVVRYVGPAVRRQSRDLVVEAVVNNPDQKLRPGMFVTARLNLGEAAAPVVPEAALRVDGPLRHVFVVKEGRLEDRLVQTGEARDGRVAIVSGVKAGEQVVAKVSPELRDGLHVEGGK
jgi:membrane fusion protein (multidrug efflux system)